MKSRAYRQGRRRGRRNIRKNPYPKGSQRFNDHSAGWLNGARARLKRRKRK